MSKALIVASAFVLAAALGVSGAQAGGRSSSSGGLLGLNLNVGNLVTAKASVGGSSNGHSSGDSLLGLNLNVDSVASAKVNVGGNSSLVAVKADVGSTGHSQGLVTANVNVGGGGGHQQVNDCYACGGHEGGVGGW